MELRLPESQPAKRRTIGYLGSTIEDGIAKILWSGIQEHCEANGLNLVSFIGRELESPGGFSRHSNMVYDMVDRDQVDGLIVWASSLSSFVGPEPIQRFCERYRPLPLVAIGMPIPGSPSIILDSYQGMRAVLLHLIQEHSVRRLAFLRGPDQHYEARLRYQAYLDVVKECELDDDPQLIAPGFTWDEEWGAEATRILLEERRVKFDALGCVNDSLAIGAIQYLQKRNINVPGDVAVTGFDNSKEGRCLTPPLTTVPTRMRERGRMAVRILMAQFAGESVPELVTLPTRVRVRLSCGCPDPQVVDAGKTFLAPETIGPVEKGAAWDAEIRARREVIIAEMEQALEVVEGPSGWAGDLLDTFLQDLDGEFSDDRFLAAMKRILSYSAPAAGELNAWQEPISTLRARVIPLMQADAEIDRLDRADKLLHQARVMIGESAVRLQGYADLRKGQQLNDLLRIRQGVSGAQTLKELVEMLARELPDLGIQRCYLALYDDPHDLSKGARYVLAYDENRRYTELEGQLFAAQSAVSQPLQMVQRGDPHCLVVYPLYYLDDLLGFISLDVRNFLGTVHQILCEQVSSALKSVMLVEQNTQLYRQALEAQRLAEEANLLKSRFLSMVSHELLTPMVLLVGLSEMMLREGIGNRPPLPEAYHQDLTRIHAGAQQLGSLVRDVLDLARGQLGQLKLVKRPVNLEEVFKPVVLVGEQMARSKGLTWQVELPPDLPQILGDSSRLQQVALNLVSNAVKFTAQGRVKLSVEVEDGQVTVSVEDTGLGVPQSEQEAIFDEFRQSERTVARGYGGLGIGLAICRRMIEMHGGKIGVRSGGDENSGSTFYFVLPVLEAAPPTQQVPPSQTVLVLTSIAARAARLKEHLIREGFKVEIVGIDETSGWLADVLSAPPGAVVLDVPVAQRGWELMELLKNNPATQDIPVIFYSFLIEQSSGSMLTMDYLLKPVPGAVLGRALERYGLMGQQLGASGAVLLVDDDLDILDIHSRMVAEHIPGCRVLRAANGRAALDLMQQEVPGLVLLDLMMPELDGAAVLKAMHEDVRLRNVPVIVLTAQSLTQEEMARLNQGVVAVLSKGVFTSEETLAHIDQALAQSKRVGSDAQRLVRKVMAYIHEHYPEPLSRDQLSSYAGVSERHLNRCFQQETGLSPGSYLNRYRIQKAKCLLKERELSITEVMEAVGFFDSSYFTHVFRREVGVSPREYQRGER